MGHPLIDQRIVRTCPSGAGPLRQEERILRQHRSKDPPLPLCGLLLGVVEVGFYFFDLVGVALGVGGGEEDEFIGIPFAADRAVDRMIAQAGCVFDKGFGFGAAFDEVVDRALGGNRNGCWV
jgi:hypothetical protein